MFIGSFTQICLGRLQVFSWYPWFLWTYPDTRQRILKISLSQIFSWCNLGVLKSRYLENCAISYFLFGPFRVQDGGTRQYLKRLQISRMNNYKFITSYHAKLTKQAIIYQPFFFNDCTLKQISIKNICFWLLVFPRQKMVCYPIRASSLYFLFLWMKRVSIDNWPKRAFSIEIWGCL